MENVVELRAAGGVAGTGKGGREAEGRQDLRFEISDFKGEPDLKEESDFKAEKQDETAGVAEAEKGAGAVEGKQNLRFEISDFKGKKEAERAGVPAVKKPWPERVVRSWEEVLARVPVAKADGRYFIPGAREILVSYWMFVSETGRRPTRREFERRLPRWGEFFKSFRELERVVGVVWEKGKRTDARKGTWGEVRGRVRIGGGMLTEPVNEQGVVLLFGVMAKELGFVVERIGTRFPDCVAARKVDGEWREVRIEFEFLSSRFDHDPAGCDLVVCWENDWKGCPVEVLPLAERVRFSKGQRSVEV